MQVRCSLLRARPSGEVVSSWPVPRTRIRCHRHGLPGVEYYSYPWEFGARKAKEPLMPGNSIEPGRPGSGGVDDAPRIAVIMWL